MNAVIYCSFSGQCKAVAEKLGEKLDFKTTDYSSATEVYENAVIVFPVHCQGLPLPLINFLKALRAESVALIALYGRMSAGNAIYEAFKLTGKVVAAAYLPANHTYGAMEIPLPEVPDEVIGKIYNPSYIKIPRRAKAPFAGVLPAARSRALVRTVKNGNCTECGICNLVCPLKCMRFGKTGRECIRCMKCVYSCPNGALEIKTGAILKKYLAKPRFCKTIIYV